MLSPEGELKISFGYQCNSDRAISCNEIQRTSSFSWLSGAALSANATLANTNICNGVIGEDKSFRFWTLLNHFVGYPLHQVFQSWTCYHLL